MTSKVSLGSLLVLVAFCAASCYLRPASVPMPAVRHAAPAGDARGLVVFLPGLSDGPDDYVANGFVDLVHELRPDFDVLAVDAHFGYYRAMSVTDRLYEDHLASVRDRYDEIWLVGISMGGLGSSLFAARHEGLVDGVVLLAPYMGDPEVFGEVKEAGGLASWSPPDGWRDLSKRSKSGFYELWNWYRGYAAAPTRSPSMFIGYGSEDRLRVPNELLAEALPEDHVLVRPGGHKWVVWKPIFAELLPRALGGE